MSINNNNNYNNNNKRDIDNNEISDNEIDNQINKKQKLDNSSNDNVNENNNIDVSNLKQQTVIKLKEIAISLGIQHRSNIKKQDLIDKITFFINKKQETIKQNEIVDNINSFNKVVVEFKIKDGVDESEWLFWKIFRNKFIYKRIMSFMDTHITQTYESITSVEKMIKSNQLYILCDKVIRNQYLKFDIGYNIKRNGDAIFNIFNHFKQDELFYKSFFKNYGKYIPGFLYKEILIKNKKEDNETIINKLINSNNILALNILIQDYNFKPTNDNLKYSIENGRLKFIKLFLQPKFNLNVKDSILNLKLCGNQKKYKVLNYLYDEKLIGLLEIKYILVNLSINHNTTLKELITIIKSIINSTTGTLVKDQQQQIQQLIDSNHFTKEELKLEITSSSLSNNKQSLKSLIEFYYKFGKSIETNDEIPVTDLFYHLYLCDDESVIDKLNIYNNKGFILNKFEYYLQISLGCANFKTLYYILNNHHSYTRTEEKFSESIKSNHLFTFCKQDKEKQIQFINSVINASPKQSYQDVFRWEDFILYLIVYDDVQLVKHYFNGISHLSSLMDIISKGEKITSYINSNEMLEYLFDHFYKPMSNNIFSFKNIQLLYKFEELYKKKFGNYTQIVYNDHIYPTKSFKSKEISIHILSNPSLYRMQSDNLYKIILQFLCEFSHDAVFQMCKLVYLNYQLFDNYIFIGSKFDNLKRSIGFTKFIDWLFIFKKEDINHYFREIDLALFRAGRYNSVYKNQEIPIKELDGSLNSFEDIKLLDYYLNRLASMTKDKFNLISGKKIVYNILYDCIDDGRLKSLEHIYQNHNWVFKTKKPTSIPSKPNNNVIDGYFIKKQRLKTILLPFIELNYLDLLEILFQAIPITKKEFNNHSTGVTRHYFENKKFK